MDTEENTMRELTDIELNEVAGGDPFGNFALAAVTQAIANVGFNVGSVVGVNVGLNAGTIFG
jgi:hypothetical protein